MFYHSTAHQDEKVSQIRQHAANQRECLDKDLKPTVKQNVTTLPYKMSKCSYNYVNLQKK